MKEILLQEEAKEAIEKKIEGDGLVCNCGKNVYDAGQGPVEEQPNYNKYFEYLECPKCGKLYYL